MATSLGLLSWAMIAMYLVAMERYRLEALGSFIVPLAFLTAASAGIPVTTPVTGALSVQEVWQGLYIVLALLGYTALPLTFSPGVLYLMQARQLKSKCLGAWYHSLPSLTLLDEVRAKALLLGFFFLDARHRHGFSVDQILVGIVPVLASQAARATVGGFVWLSWRRTLCIAYEAPSGPWSTRTWRLSWSD